jgi:hypothetical protein
VLKNNCALSGDVGDEEHPGEEQQLGFRVHMLWERAMLALRDPYHESPALAVPV